MIKQTLLCILVLFLCLCAEKGFAQSGETGASGYPGLRESIETAIVAEKENIRQLTKQLSQARELEKEVGTKLNRFKSQLSSHDSLLLLPTTRVKDIENAWAAHRAYVHEIASQLKELARERDNFERLLRQAEEQYDLNNKQLLEINIDSHDTSVTQALADNLVILIRLLSDKIQNLEKLYEIYNKNASQIKETQKTFIELSEKFDQQIKIRQKKELFRRLLFLNIKRIQDDINLFANQARLMVSGNFWVNELRGIRGSGGFLLVSCLLLFTLIQTLLFRVRRYYFALEKERSLSRQYPWRHLILQLFYRSLLLFGTTVFLYSYANIRDIYSSVHLIRVVFYVLLIWLFSGWALDFLKLWNQRETNHIPNPLVFRLRVLLIMTRYFAIVYVTLEWILGYTNFILFFLRVVFEITLLIWCVRFWKAFRGSAVSEISGDIASNKRLPVVIGLSYVIVIGGLVPEFAGFGSLALYWYKSWGSSAILLLWGSLFFFLLFEWNRRFKESSGPMPDGTVKPATPIKWLFIRISWLAWFGILCVCILFAWGAKQAVILGFFQILNKSFPVGGMNLSFLGFVYGFLILLCTHAAARLWKHTLIEKFLAHSGLEPGIKESVKTITVYIFWIFGILISLNIVGISSTSVTVAFGALGIGLGFGLQNIFSNFVSGIILLFERPIQVGDAVEVSGIWGEVKKINVRSTLVQTYDNASLIIPNSEFISSQVTNWSFKDPRVRRTVTIGVAYGSDIKLVRKTLLDIADRTPEVYKYPSPTVIFTDFGDSALIFQLRIWTHVDLCLSVETDIRFEIDRLFKEKNIEIPFPQRDVHMYQATSQP